LCARSKIFQERTQKLRNHGRSRRFPSVALEKLIFFDMLFFSIQHYGGIKCV